MAYTLKNITHRAAEAIRYLYRHPIYLFAMAVWATFWLLIFLFYKMSAPEGIEVGRFWMTTISSATFFTIPLFWCPPRQRWSLWAVMSVLTIYMSFSLVYQRNFSTLMPLNSIFQIKNINLMVWESATATWLVSDLLMLLPLAILTALWFFIFRKKIKGKAFSVKSAKVLTLASLIIWLSMQCIAVASYTKTNPYSYADSGRQGVWHNTMTKFRGKIMSRTDYLYYNGLDMYLMWSLGDYFPRINLNATDERLITGFIERQREADLKNPILAERADSFPGKRNLLIIMIESFETWPLEYKIDGKPCLPMLDSLINAPGTLYFPHLVTQVSAGHSSDGHLMDLTGLLPLRELAAVTDFYDNDYPSVIKAFKEKYGGTTFEIISDNPKMWNQSETFMHYGFDQLYDVVDIDPKHKSNWTYRDSYLGSYTASKLRETQTPFACMTVTLSLHTPYKSTIKGYEEIDRAGIHPESVHYLKVCRMDEQYIGWMINALKQRGIYDETTIVITGDHNAHSLFEKYRPAGVSGKENFIPLIVLNSGFKTKRFPAVAGQIDIYPTLLDILGLDDYKWRGVGRSLLRYEPGCATRRTMETYGTADDKEIMRQRTAWDVSDLLIRSNYLDNI